jgi:hypothetical protein
MDTAQLNMYFQNDLAELLEKTQKCLNSII